MAIRIVTRVLVGLLALVLIVVGAGAAVLSSDWAAARAQRELRALLEAKFNGTVDVKEISFSIFPRLAVSGEGLTISQSSDRSKLTLLTLERFTAAGSLPQFLRRRIALVEIDGFQIDIQRGAHPPKGPPPRRSPDLAIDHIRVKNGLLRMLPSDPQKEPLDFVLTDVSFDGFSFERPGRYAAVLTNPKPEGLIRSTGTFGPWNTLAPHDTPLGGDYVFSEARLDTIKGIGGILSSTGSFKGILERIEVEGTTTTPDFQLDLAHQPIPLDTKFKATVDGTNGNTYLHEVDATLGQTHILAKGAVTGTPGVKGRTVSLDVTADGRFDDFMRLAVKAAEPVMSGGISLTTTFLLPPGEADVPERLRLKGTFHIRDGRFGSDAVQGKVDELSRRGRGEPENRQVAQVGSDFSGDFSLHDGRLELPRIEFAVEGARVALGGSYGMRAQALDFKGALTLDAKVSQTTTGYKSLLLRMVDPLFSRNGAGTVLPIVVGGTVEKPAFGVDARRTLLRR